MDRVLLSPVEGATMIYESADTRGEVDVSLGNLSLMVPAAFVDVDDLESIFPGEQYAGTMGGMFFISTKLPEDYHRFAAFHELAEHAAPRGFDVTGLAAHLQAITLELGYAKATLSPMEFKGYCQWRKRIETSKFFRYQDREQLVDFAEKRMREIFQTIPKFITLRKRPLVELIIRD